MTSLHLLHLRRVRELVVALDWHIDLSTPPLIALFVLLHTGIELNNIAQCEDKRGGRQQRLSQRDETLLIGFSNRLGARSDIKLAEDTSDMKLDRGPCDAQLLGDLAI